LDSEKKQRTQRNYLWSVEEAAKSDEMDQCPLIFVFFVAPHQPHDLRKKRAYF